MTYCLHSLTHSLARSLTHSFERDRQKSAAIIIVILYITGDERDGVALSFVSTQRRMASLLVHIAKAKGLAAKDRYGRARARAEPTDLGDGESSPSGTRTAAAAGRASERRRRARRRARPGC